MKTLRAEGRK